MSGASRAPRRPLVVAHRGGSPDDIDNSLAAFEHALAVGAHLIECDLRLSRDGVIVLYHDAKVGGERVSALTLDELRARVPTLLTLAELFDRLSRETVRSRVTLDLKDRDVDRALAPCLRERGLTRDALITSQHMPALRRLRGQFPGLRLGLSRGQICGGRRRVWLRELLGHLLEPVIFIWLLPQLRWSRATAVALQYRLVTPRLVRRFNRAGYRVYTWTVDDCNRTRYLSRCGVDMIATNMPREILACLGYRQRTR
jgi:glycerophosphoryl diester phosphodiesterase